MPIIPNIFTLPVTIINRQAVGQILSTISGKKRGGLLLGSPTYKILPNGSMIVSVSYYSSDPKIVNVKGITKKDFVANFPLAPFPGLAGPSVELRFIKVQYPYLDNNILAQYTALNANKYAFSRIHSAMFKKGKFFSAVLPSTSGSLPYLLKGLKLELAGRLTTQRNIPRKTVSNKHIGNIGSSDLRSARPLSLAKPMITTNSNFNQYTSKNKLGAYTIKVWLA